MTTSVIAKGLFTLLHAQAHTMTTNYGVLMSTGQNMRDIIMLSFLTTIPFESLYVDIIDEIIEMNNGQNMKEIDIVTKTLFNVSYIDSLNLYKDTIIRCYRNNENNLEKSFDMSNVDISVFDVQSSIKS